MMIGWFCFAFLLDFPPLPSSYIYSSTTHVVNILEDVQLVPQLTVGLMKTQMYLGPTSQNLDLGPEPSSTQQCLIKIQSLMKTQSS